ncbi:MAG: glycerol-3-phosphate 1-O-acyltransferase PlsY [Helicobacteraceae bacterium]|jgi:glycerol-3-phosphate acyltransferase PlsY|nr:glycerol-3-phosphate 1-O-acyltransferase PlsY [Helicobacteraceae bacterium]
MDFLANILTNINIQFYLAAYLIGAIPFGVLLAWAFGGVNIRAHGSGSVGATNVLRVVKERDSRLATKLAIATFACDALKGPFVMGMAVFMGLDAHILWTIALLAVVGHCFSPYLFFEGGKGVATGVGVVMFLLPIEAALGLLAWFVAAKVFKISSLASLAGMITAVALSFVIHPEVPVIKSHAPIVIIGFIILYKHIPNLLRLFRKEEAKIA